MFRLARPVDATQALLTREVWLTDQAALIANQRLLWESYQNWGGGLTPDTSSDHDPILQGWLDLGLIAWSHRTNTAAMRRGLLDWQTANLSHPANRVLIPELLRIGVFQRGKILHRNVDNLCFSVPFWCFMGVVVDGFYRAQAVWFGAEAVFPVVLTKVIIDQFVYNPLFAAPLTAALYDWKNRGYGLHEFGGFFKVRYYRDVVVPTLFATWGVWIPVVSILYSLPSLLQIPLFALALSMWVTLYTWMSERRIDEGRAHLL